VLGAGQPRAGSIILPRAGPVKRPGQATGQRGLASGDEIGHDGAHGEATRGGGPEVSRRRESMGRAEEIAARVRSLLAPLADPNSSIRRDLGETLGGSRLGRR